MSYALFVARFEPWHFSGKVHAPDYDAIKELRSRLRLNRPQSSAEMSCALGRECFLVHGDDLNHGASKC